ncbi:MAG: beta-glucuronidase [Gammaproteobacteria bacterium]|nr:beta-glucuronidase [Gammaproteobacteria bacterium]CAD5128113.1 Glycosyl hydrolase, family 2 [Gammaproteobacteria bacterium]
MLKPVENQFRERKSLNGLWQFSVDRAAEGRQQQWWLQPLPAAREIPVPASYNDIFPEAEIRDHVGDVWYQTETFIPAGWKDQRIVLRFDAATHRGTVWVNDVLVMDHQGGYTPFEADISAYVQAGKSCRLTVCVNNVLSWDTIPPGQVLTQPDGRLKQQYFHDFFNYAGLHRSVWLYATPKAHIQDVIVVTEYDGCDGVVDYSVVTTGTGSVSVRLIDEAGKEVAAASGEKGRLQVANATPWQPGKAYLYTLSVQFSGEQGTGDAYSLAVGIRSVKVEGKRFLINGEPFYFTGFGKHEDSDLRGKAHDDVMMVHDFELMNWIGANSFRTSHYPYAEEVLDYADRHGIVVINETAAVGLNMVIGKTLNPQVVEPKELYSEEGISKATQQAHLAAISELIARDKNHPCVVAWSITNEPDSSPDNAYAYFKPLVDETRRLDPSRPVTYASVMFVNAEKDKIAALFDVICLNRYFGWYTDAGDLKAAERMLEADLRAWEEKYGVPLIITEYGADTMNGLRSVVPSMWTEEFQIEFLNMYHRVFDRVEAVVGEQVWNFADFATSQGIIRVGGNKKGIFTRDRRPKSSAYALRKRWTGMSATHKKDLFGG